ncbi:MAG: hypothetical protein IJL74_00475 [Bacilli bacterium]|nr:hypothetical protein [Bacilli bacterium]
MTKIWGIDISTWQRGYPYAKAKKEGVKFAILRAGFSETKDNMFETHYKNAKAQGWGVGAYWYTYAKTVSQANREAKAFIKAIKGKKFEYPIYLDIEDKSIRKAGRTTLNNIVKEFNKVINGAGYYFGVYSNVDWYRNVISGSTLNKSYDWWIASWTSTKPSGVNAGLWQFGGSSNAIRSPRVAGVVTDQNYAYKDYPAIMKNKGLNGYGKTPVKPKNKYTGIFPTLPKRGYFFKGDKGQQVKYLQMFLNWALDTKLVVDGILGDKTFLAIKQFQNKVNITIDGLFGKVSLAKAKSFAK